jgi:hypothetical protein
MNMLLYLTCKKYKTIKYDMIANNILVNHNGNTVVFLYPTPNSLKLSDLFSNIISGFINATSEYNTIYTKIIAINRLNI